MWLIVVQKSDSAKSEYKVFYNCCYGQFPYITYSTMADNDSVCMHHKNANKGGNNGAYCNLNNRVEWDAHIWQNRIYTDDCKHRGNGRCEYVNHSNNA